MSLYKGLLLTHVWIQEVNPTKRVLEHAKEDIAEGLGLREESLKAISSPTLP
jgi:hypothetical protein